ncbi:glycosyltransferase family 2 protein [Rhodococcus spelaei]|uniref:glycosyltransferase family 2 protein n=1 Tax=Rhodococcus spelaei TaxID=2546320 RepID=UPI001FE64451|nr:glycosyltransferase family 2 protein [Rhodococcus spelaei]
MTVVIPCRNESGSLPGVLAAMPDGYRALVVDNGSADGTADVARECGAEVVYEPEPGYGSAVHAGVLAARTPIVCVLDGDGSLDPGELPELVRLVRAGADLAVGRRRPAPHAGWPVHARLGNTLIARRLRRRYGLDVHDIGAVRVCRRERLLALGVTDRRSGYPLEVLVRAAQAGLRVEERDVTYRPRTAGSSKVSGSVAGSVRAVRDFWKVLT